MVIIEKTWPWYCLSFCLFYYYHGIVCPFFFSIMTMVLSLLLFFLLWPWYCLSFCFFYYDHRIVCPFVFSIMTMVLSLLFSFLLRPWYCLSFYSFYYDHVIVCPFFFSNITMVLCVILSFLLWPWYCLSFCLFIWFTLALLEYLDDYFTSHYTTIVNGCSKYWTFILLHNYWCLYTSLVNTWEGQTIQWPNDKRQKDKQWSTKYFTENSLESTHGRHWDSFI
jgi:hypothetical protein